MENERTIPTRQARYGYGMENKAHDTHKDKSDVGIRKNVGGKYPTKLNKFGMKTKKQVRYPMIAYNRGYKCENIEIIPMIREALFHRLTL